MSFIAEIYFFFLIFCRLLSILRLFNYLNLRMNLYESYFIVLLLKKEILRTLTVELSRVETSTIAIILWLYEDKCVLDDTWLQWVKFLTLNNRNESIMILSSFKYYCLLLEILSINNKTPPS